MKKYAQKTIATASAALFLFLQASSVVAGTYCGSDESLAGSAYKQLTSDWWPDLMTSLVINFVLPISTVTGAFCASTQGQAYFGSACYSHDACYEGKEGLGMTRRQCDLRLRDSWRQSCESQYNPSWWGDIGQEYCRDYCKSTVDAMYTALSASSGTAWDAAAPERDANITAAINGVYGEIFRRPANSSEIQTSKNYLASTKSLDALRTKVKQDYQLVAGSLNVITGALSY